ncbi:hypothetical protein BJV82DRAFT_229300 [Fennellomyces sp. T-0311]|nr:hypothetical protein BJV82DRAFT_229300 [Fennellomyces sp. T-0311]
MQTTEKHSTPKALSNVSPLPPHSIIFRPPNQAESDSSFSHYIDRQFQPYSAVLQDRASLQPKAMIAEPAPRQPTNIRPADIARVPEQPVQSPERPAQHVRVPEPSALHAPLPEDAPQQASLQHNDEERQQKYPWWILSDNDEDGFYSIGGILFLFGFICPVLWWIGACWPRHPRERAGKMAERWQQLNLIMSLGFSVLLVIALIVLAVTYSQVT